METLLSNHLYGSGAPNGDQSTSIEIPPFTAADTFLSPESFTAQLLGVVSPWIDLCSPDPILYNVSRQILKMELNFAQFCGLAVVVLPSPTSVLEQKSKSGISQYANAVKDALESCGYVQVCISMQMMDAPSDLHDIDSSLAHLARPEYTESIRPTLNPIKEPPKKDNEPFAEGTEQESDLQEDGRSNQDTVRKRITVHDFLGTWDIWNTIRTFCNFHPRLFIGQSINSQCN